MSKHALPILPSVTAAYEFALGHWRSAALAGLPFLVIELLRYALLNQMPAAPSAVMRLADTGLSLAGTVALILFMTSMIRLAIRSEYPRPIGLRLGSDEWRSLIVVMLIALLVLLVTILALVFVLALVNAVALGVMEREGISQEMADADINLVFAAFGTSEWGIVAAIGFAFFILVAWLGARLMLGLPATIDQQAVRVLRVWPLSDGQAGRMILVSLLVFLPVNLALIGFYEVVSTGLGQRPLLLPHLLDPSLPQGQADILARLWEIRRVNGLALFLSAPLFAGLFSSFYKRLSEAAPSEAG